jgi:hypothetical protein
VVEAETDVVPINTKPAEIDSSSGRINTNVSILEVEELPETAYQSCKKLHTRVVTDCIQQDVFQNKLLKTSTNVSVYPDTNRKMRDSHPGEMRDCPRTRELIEETLDRRFNKNQWSGTLAKFHQIDPDMSDAEIRNRLYQAVKIAPDPPRFREWFVATLSYSIQEEMARRLPPSYSSRNVLLEEKINSLSAAFCDPDPEPDEFPHEEEFCSKQPHKPATAPEGTESFGDLARQFPQTAAVVARFALGQEYFVSLISGMQNLFPTNDDEEIAANMLELLHGHVCPNDVVQRKKLVEIRKPVQPERTMEMPAMEMPVVVNGCPLPASHAQNPGTAFEWPAWLQHPKKRSESAA